MSCIQPINESGLLFDHIVGTGGIGSGIFFSMSHEHTLGRNESRMAALLPYKDFCKQHIIMHYIAVLLGAKENGDFQSFPIGKVGNDDIGTNLIARIKDAGMNTRNITAVENFSTLFSVCFQYPDKSGGNITTENSASSEVSPIDIDTFFHGFTMNGAKEILLAAPEVPLPARIRLLQYGRQRGSLTVASLLSSEVNEFENMHGFEMVDMLFVNIDEAQSIARLTDESAPVNLVLESCIKALTAINPGITILITNGANGNYCYANNHLEFTPVFKVPVVSTAGAGDAFLAGTVAGLCCGLPLTKEQGAGGSQPGLESAVELGTLLASFSVTSPDTIHAGASAAALCRFAVENNIKFGKDFIQLFESCLA